METKRAVQAHVMAYMREHNLSESQLARRVGLPQATLNRMLADNPSYKGQVSAWRTLAAYQALGLDEAEVLAAVGLGPKPNGGQEDDPWRLLEAAMRGFRLSERYRDHLRRQVEFLLAAHQTEAPNGC